MKLNEYQIYLKSIIKSIPDSKKSFLSEKKHHIKQAGMKQALVSWISGLCDAVPVAYENYKIIKLYENWLERKLDQREIDYILENWFIIIAENLQDLWIKYEI